MGFKVGDEVSWSSASNGSWKEKIGDVVEVIPAGVVCIVQSFAMNLMPAAYHAKKRAMWSAWALNPALVRSPNIIGLAYQR